MTEPRTFQECAPDQALDEIRRAARLLAHLRATDGMHLAVAEGTEEEEAAEGRLEVYSVALDALRTAEDLLLGVVEDEDEEIPD